MLIVRYLQELFDLFVKWWWAVITGVASILSWLAIPDSGITIGKIGVAVGILAVGLVFFMMLSIITKSFSWFTERARPTVVRFSSTPGSAAVTFVLRPVGEPVHAGYLLAVFRHHNDDEIPIAVLKVDRGDLPMGDVQCTSVWISPIHRLDLAGGQVQVKDLSVRRAIPDRLLEQLRGTVP